MINSTNLLNDLNTIRSKSPLIHNITNYVVMNNSANALLSIGASPVMAHSVHEVKEMTSIASSLVINIGTLSEPWVDAMILAIETANKNQIPVILDPVGAGATSYRTQVCLRIIQNYKISVIRGNASEIMALNNENNKTKGVDSIATSEAALEAAKSLTYQSGAIVVISGATDYITNGTKVTEVKNGTSMMAKVTGMGCTASAITGAFAAVNPNFFESCTHAMAIMGISGELASKKANGPGTLQLHFLDTLYNLTETEILETLIAS